MIVLGLAGQAGVGKDVVADYLVSAYGFVKFAFSDALYAEVQAAYGLEDQTLLRNRDIKELASYALALDRCGDLGFVEEMVRVTVHPADPRPPIVADVSAPLSPRQVLQWWGTDYRRAQNPEYWLHKAEDFLLGLCEMYQYPEQAPQHFVECGTRFENERDWIHSGAFDRLFTGNIWHIHRDSQHWDDPHSSARPLPILENERELYNNDTVVRLHRGIDLLLTTQAKFVKVEPMLPEEAPE